MHQINIMIFHMYRRGQFNSLHHFIRSTVPKWRTCYRPTPTSEWRYQNTYPKTQVIQGLVPFDLSSQEGENDVPVYLRFPEVPVHSTPELSECEKGTLAKVVQDINGLSGVSRPPEPAPCRSGSLRTYMLSGARLTMISHQGYAPNSRSSNPAWISGRLDRSREKGMR